MDKSFFLTTENAALLESGEREINTHAGLCVVHGASGVGKTRLLRELVEARIDARVRWVDLASGGGGGGTLIDSSELIEQTITSANPGDVIVADHFESALKKTRHQLFLSWSTEGIDKRLGLIIGAQDDSLGELRQLAQHYQVTMQPHNLKPLNVDDVRASLELYLFPERSPGRLAIPPPLQSQLSAAQGNVNEIIGIAEHAGDRLNEASREVSAPKSGADPKHSSSQAMMATLVSAVAILASVGWYLFDANRHDRPVAAAATTGQPAVATIADRRDKSPPVTEIANRANNGRVSKTDSGLSAQGQTAATPTTSTSAFAGADEAGIDALGGTPEIHEQAEPVAREAEGVRIGACARYRHLGRRDRSDRGRGRRSGGDHHLLRGFGR